MTYSMLLEKQDMDRTRCVEVLVGIVPLNVYNLESPFADLAVTVTWSRGEHAEETPILDDSLFFGALYSCRCP